MRERVGNGFALVEFTIAIEENRHLSNTFPQICAVDCGMCAEEATKPFIGVEDTWLSEANVAVRNRSLNRNALIC